MVTLLEGKVRHMLEDFVRLWNTGKLEKACACYAEDASFIGAHGYIRGKQNIIERYQREYPDRPSMGRLKLEILEFRPADSPAYGAIPMGTAVLRWTVENQKGTFTGFALETYVQKLGKITLVQDATIPSEEGELIGVVATRNPELQAD